MEIINAVGRRKAAVARAYLSKNEGTDPSVTINGRSLDQYFPIKDIAQKVLDPMQSVEGGAGYTVKITVDGGGLKGQAVFEEIEQFPEMASSLHKESLQPALESYEKTSYHIVQNQDFVEGVKKFLQEHPCDIIYLISRKHNFWTSLFKEKHAKEMAFHGDIPILSNLEC